MIKISGVYIIECIQNGKKLVGESSNVYKRFNYHKQNLKNNRHENPYLQNAYNKYGIDKFKFYILEYCDPKNTKKLENYWCNLLKTHDSNYGYNIRPTEDINKRPMSEETKAKIKKSLLSSEKFKNRDCGKAMRGKKHTDEVKQKIKDNRKYKEHSEETKKKISIKNKGKKISELSIVKIINSRKNNDKPWHSDETKRKIGEANKGRIFSNEAMLKRIEISKKFEKKVLKLDKELNILSEFDSSTKAAKEIKCSQGSLSNACRHNAIKRKRYRTIKNFIWIYKIDYSGIIS